MGLNWFFWNSESVEPLHRNMIQYDMFRSASILIANHLIQIGPLEWVHESFCDLLSMFWVLIWNIVNESFGLQIALRESFDSDRDFNRASQII